MTIACFGDSYSHTYAAAQEVLRAESRAGDKLESRGSIYEALLSVAQGECGLAVVPIENSYEGTVTATCDWLDSLGLFIVRETVLPIKHSLIVKEGVRLEDVKKVYSHPQALAQCRASLEKILPEAEKVAVAYTSAGLDMLGADCAAIARAPKAGQIALCESIEDSPDNCTRFITVRAEPRLEGDKVSVVFSAADEPGALLGALSVLRSHGLNMTKIESRPAKKRLGQYKFYVDFLFGGDNRELQKLLAEIGEETGELRFLGRYFKAK